MKLRCRGTSREKNAGFGGGTERAVDGLHVDEVSARVVRVVAVLVAREDIPWLFHRPAVCVSEREGMRACVCERERERERDRACLCM